MKKRKPLDPKDIWYVTPTKICPMCGVEFERWCAGSGGVSSNGYHGSAYCRPCGYKRVKENQKQPSNIIMWCSGCGVEFRPSKRQVYAHKAYGGSPAPNKNWYCSDKCCHQSKKVSKDGLCLAPCAPRCTKVATEAYGLCAGHGKRRERGRPIDTPLKAYHYPSNEKVEDAGGP